MRSEAGAARKTKGAWPENEYFLMDERISTPKILLMKKRLQNHKRLTGGKKRGDGKKVERIGIPFPWLLKISFVKGSNLNWNLHETKDATENIKQPEAVPFHIAATAT